MPSLVVPVLKFVGTVSLGLLTGISCSQALLTAPSLLLLPNATAAHEASTSIRAQTAVHGTALLLTSITSYTLAYILAPPRGGKHPYLLWTSLVAASGAATSAYLASSHDGSKPTLSRAGTSSSQHRVDGEDDDYVDATHSTAALTPTSGSSDAGFGLHDDGPSTSATATSTATYQNGEQVRRGLEVFGTVEGIRAGITGLAFFMAVVGIWGDGSGLRRR